jgi:hypothetical protein
MRRFSLRFNGVITCVLVYEDYYPSTKPCIKPLLVRALLRRCTLVA